MSKSNIPGIYSYKIYENQNYSGVDLPLEKTLNNIY